MVTDSKFYADDEYVMGFFRN